VTHVFPVSDGFVIGSCVRHIPLAGKDITKFILQHMRDRGEKIPGDDAMEIAQKVKERFGYVCKDIVKEYAKYDKKTMDESGRIFQNNKFKKYVHKSMNGETTEIDIGYERFLGPEMFFHPEFIHQDWRSPLDEIVDNAIQSCPIDTRRKLYENIVLSGGSTLFKDFDKRLNYGIQTRVDDRLREYEKITGQAPKPIKVTVSQNMVQRYAVWFGGSVLGSSEHFPKICHSREDYMERGPSICRHNPVFPQCF
jgi:actin-related protein 3